MSEMYEIAGACRYCGQVRIMNASRKWSQEEADDEATRNCECGEAKNERLRKERVLKARNNIAILCAELPQGAVEWIQAGVNAVETGAIDAVAVRIENARFEIKRDSDGHIITQATERHTKKMQA